MGLKKSIKETAEGFGGAISAITGAWLLGASVPLMTALGYLIILKTGIWWLPLITVMLVLMGVPVAARIERRERYNYHMQVGHEVYYGENPEALKKELKKARRSGISEGVQIVAAGYRARPYKIEKFTERREEKRRKRAVLLYCGAGIAALIGIFMLLRAFPIPEGFFSQKLKTADYTEAFLIIGGVLALISAAGLFVGKRIRTYRYVAVIIMILSVWSAGVGYTLHKRTTYMDCLTNAGCLAVFLLTAFVVPAIAGDIRTAEQVSRDKKELKIGLYELGYIKEEELREL